MPIAGTILQNRYHILFPLGKGGMGAVYCALDTHLNISIAIKEMTPQPGINPQRLAQLQRQFHQEASILAHLDHPNMVEVNDFFEETGHSYLVMNFVEGESLEQRIQDRGVQSEEQILAWADQLLDALSYCHDKGVIHRDIKPSNIIIQPNHRAVLVDFGLAKLWNVGNPDQTQTAVRGIGTPEYAPPEQYSELPGHTDPRSDIYSLGATLYHALTGKPPMMATDRIAQPDQFATARRLNPRVSTSTDSAVMRALSLSLADRFQTALEMRAALARQTSQSLARSDQLHISHTRTLTRHTDLIYELTFSPDGKTLVSVSGDATAQVHRVRDGALLHTLRGNSGRVMSVAFSPDGTNLVTGADDNTVRLWRSSDGLLLQTLLSHLDGIPTVAYSPNGAVLASSLYNNTIRLWKVQSPRQTLHGHSGQVVSVAFSSSGAVLASAGKDNTARIWRTSDGKQLRVLQHTNHVLSVAFSPDETLLASGTTNAAIRIWRMGKRAPLFELSGHTDSITSMTFSPDGTLLASGSYDGTVCFWRVGDGTLLYTLKKHPVGIKSLAFSPSGKLLATAALDNVIRLWKIV
jgi:serine/threonine protein kinase